MNRRLGLGLLSAGAVTLSLGLYACATDDNVAAPGGADASAPFDAAGPRANTGAVDDAAAAADASPDAGAVDDAGDGGADAATDDGAVAPTYSRCPLTLDASGDAGAWGRDFTSGEVSDPEGDDTGDGDYRYPDDIDPKVDGGAGVGGIADLTKFELSYSASTQELAVSVGVRHLTDNTRIGVVVWDAAHFPATDAGPLAAADLEWSMTGNELRLPNWNEGGVTFLLAKPSATNTTFDLAVKRNLSSLGVETRPDNAVYVQRGGWLDCTGKMTMAENRFGIMELDVRSPTENELAFKLPVAALKGEIDLQTPKLYAVLYAYVLIDRPNNSDVEFGSFEITGALGGLPDSAQDNWRDPDTYDVGFVTKGTQTSLLTPPILPDGGATADDGTKLVVIHELGRGVLAIDTQP